MSRSTPPTADAARRSGRRPIRVLFVSDTGGQLGGAERSLLSLVEALDQRRYELHAVVGTEGPFAARLRGAHVRVAVRPLATIARTRNPLKLLLYAARFLRGVLSLAWRIRRLRIDVVHANKNTLAIYAIPAARLTGAASLWHARNRATNFGRVGAWLFRHCDRVVCVSESIARPFRKSFPDDQQRIAVVHEGIDPAPFAAPEAGTDLRDLLGARPGERWVGTVGRLTPWKGQDDFLRAAARVAEGDPDARFLVVGDCVASPAEQAADEAFRDRLHALAGELGITEAVRFTGYRDDVPAAMNALDVFVLPSQDEPFGIVVLEAMAAARPIVATNAGGVPEIARDGEEALLVPVGDVPAMAEAIERLLSDPELAARLARAAEARVREAFPLWRHAARLRELYETLAAREQG
ncbi:MAG: glycosyltransferase family 4 protein [bacterium]